MSKIIHCATCEKVINSAEHYYTICKSINHIHFEEIDAVSSKVVMIQSNDVEMTFCSFDCLTKRWRNND